MGGPARWCGGCLPRHGIIALPALIRFTALQAFDGLAAHRSTPFFAVGGLVQWARRTPECSGIMMALRSAALDDDPKPSQLGQRRAVAGARGSRSAGAASSENLQTGQ